MHHHFEQYGLPLGTSTILAAAVLDFAATRGLSMLSGLGIVVGMACTLGTFLIRLDDWYQRRKDRTRGL